MQLSIIDSSGQTVLVSIEEFNLRYWLRRAPHCLGKPRSQTRQSSRRIPAPPIPGFSSPSTSTVRMRPRRSATPPGARHAAPRVTGMKPRARKFR